MSRRRVAVVLFNLGGPDSLQAVRPFLFNLFRDPAIIGLPTPARQAIAALIATTRNKTAQTNYALMGGASPLLRETQAQADALQQALSADAETQTRVFIAMRYWRPFTAETAREVEAFAPQEVVLLPLYPQFSATTTASSLTEWARAYRGPGKVRTICCYPDELGLIEAHARLIEQAYADAGSPTPVRLLFSAHGLPEKVVAGGDPYQWQVERTCAAVAARLAGSWDWQVCYQSRVGPLKWLGPSTPEAIEKAAGEGRGVLVVPIAFVSEHVETLVELDIEYKHLADRIGCPAYIRVPAIGGDIGYIGGLAKSVVTALHRTPGTDSACGGRICPKQWSKCPAREAA